MYLLMHQAMLCRTLMFLGWIALAATVLPALAQPAAPSQPAPTEGEEQTARRARRDVLSDTPDYTTQIDELRHALVRLPLAAGLACVLAFRPRRRGTPPRQPPVIQTQIILAVVGAVVMLVVGTSLARAFGIVGAAGLVRYRARIADPKDAGVMLSTLAIGLASGVGLWMLAIFATAFVLVGLWVLESVEPTAYQPFALKVKAKDPAAFKPQLEQLLTRHRVRFDLRTASKEEVIYEVQMPIDRKTERLSNMILALDPNNATAVEWEEKKEKK